jgi:hypothetical protein
MTNDKFYKLSDEDIAKIKSVNADLRQYVCSCAIQENKPPHCQQGPLESSRMPDCGYTFRENIREGKCRRCGACCATPRHKGDPVWFFDPGPEGKPCKFLIVEEL